ncbi:solute carrier family 22 member 17 [Pseudonaja textilis]|uniref:solute carrier family 22 member 17 n=1 Tax=Pseudonaja textilis TaxID=8673 RepID=UPI000EA8CD90|nr:solute carrier family 22 member 17 [Pseudonaja textilis]
MDTSPPIPDPGGPRRDFTTSASEVGPPSFEWLLGRLGAWGQRRQRLLLALSCLPCVLVGLALGSDALFALTPLHHCGDPNSTKMPDNASCHGPHGQSGETGVLPILTSNPVTEWSLDHSGSWVIPLEQICFLLGFAAGAVFLGHLADSVGRRSTFLFTLALGCPAGLLAAFASSPSIFILGRCLWGTMLGAMQLTLYITRLELCCPSQRLPVAMAGDLIQVGGRFLLLGLAWVCGSWRVLQGVMSAGMGVCLLYSCPGLYPESPRWLLATRRTAQAKDVLLALCQNGNAQELEAREALNELDNACHLPAAAQISLRSLLSCRNIWKNILILGFTTSNQSIFFRRGKGLGITLALASLGGLSAPLLRVREQHGSFLEHIVLASLNILALLCLLLLPETKRKPLPESLHDGELYRRPSLLRRAGETGGRDSDSVTRRDDVPLLSTPNPSS